MLLLVASAAFAGMAYFSPVKSLPAAPVINSNMNPDSYRYIMSKYNADLLSAEFPLWLYQSYIDISIGFAIAAALASLFLLGLTVPDRPRRSVTFPKSIRYLLGATVLSCASVFVWIAVKDWLTCIRAYNGLMGSQTMELLETGMLPLAPNNSDALYLALVVVGASAFILLKSSRGFWEGLKDGITQFAAPLILLLTLGLVILAPNVMIDHFAQSVGWFYGGVHVLSNWVILIISALLTVLGLVPLLSKKKGVRN